MTKADSWAQRYLSLKRYNDSLMVSDVDAARISQLFLEGELEGAAQQLDATLKSQKKLLLTQKED